MFLKPRGSSTLSGADCALPDPGALPPAINFHAFGVISLRRSISQSSGAIQDEVGDAVECLGGSIDLTQR